VKLNYLSPSLFKKPGIEKVKAAFLLKTLIIKYHVGVLKAQFQRDFVDIFQRFLGK